MKKWLVSLMVIALIGAVSVCAGAAGQPVCSSEKFNNGVLDTRSFNRLNSITVSKSAPGKKAVRVNDRKERWNHHDRRDQVNRFREREDARYVINRTAMVLVRAQKAARIHHHYAGFARAVAHQQKAHELYKARRYQDAIYHSLRARRLAISVIKNNRANWPGYVCDDREERYRRIAPGDHELDLRIDWRKVGSDKAAVRLQFVFNI